MLSLRRTVLRVVWGLSCCLAVNSLAFASDFNTFETNNEQFSSAITVDHSFYFGNAVSLSDSLLLTDLKVEDWIKTRIEVAKLQKKMKVNASEYDNVVHAFFREREMLLESLDWTAEEFDETKERIQSAISAMDIADDLKASQAELAEEVAEIRANEFYSDQQKVELISALNEIRDQKKELYIEPTKRDWPAVRPHRETLEQVNAWIAGNSPNPPDVD